MKIIIKSDGVLERFGNQIGALGEHEARKALARAVNRVTVSVHGKVIREIVRQSSIPKAIVAKQVKRQLAHVGASGAIEGVVWSTGAPLSLKYFQPRQLSYGVRAKVRGKWERYEGAFMGPRPGVVAPRLGGGVFHRRTSARIPIEQLFGPAVPEELVTRESARVFEETVATMLPARVAHELGRLLPK